MHVKLLTLDELLAACDFITLHTTLTKDTRHLLGKEAFARIKPGVRIVNAARGELIDDEALLAALESGRVAGAALDVHASEPPVDWRLAKHPRVVATPHVGAATAEAQERVGTDIAVQVRDFLKGGVIQQAVNFFSLSGDLYDQVKPAMDLAERLGLFLGQACPGKLERIELGVYGDLREVDLKLFVSAAVNGLLRAAPAESVTIVNAVPRAKEMRLEIVESTSSASVGLREPDRAPPEDERRRPLGGGDGLRPRPPAPRGRRRGGGGRRSPRATSCWCATTTRPGMVGQVASLLGAHGSQHRPHGPRAGSRAAAARSCSSRVDDGRPPPRSRSCRSCRRARGARFLRLG